MDVSESTLHPTPERLQAFVEESLEDAERTAVSSHVDSCPRCTAEVREWRAVFAARGSLPGLAPSAGFANRVMAGVELPQPWVVRVLELLRRLVPTTTKGWAVATAFLALPVLAGTGALVWLTSQPGVTVQGLWTMTAGVLGEGLGAAGAWLWSQWLDSSLAYYAAQALELVSNRSGGAIGLALVMFATLTAASAWILYQNLFRSESRRTHYASYSF